MPPPGDRLQGKGANTPFILESRGLQRSETMSSLLERNSEIKDLMNQGELVPDTMVRAPLTLCSRGHVPHAGPHLTMSGVSWLRSVQLRYHAVVPV